MFSKIFSHGKGVFARKTLPFFLTLCFVMGAALFSGCSTGNDGPGLLEGTWTNVAFGYTTVIKIDSNAIVYEGSYEGTIENSPNFSAPDGVLIIRFTKYATNYDGNPVDTHANVGKYGALYWKELTASSVYMADAYTGYDHTIYDDFNDAKGAFTNEKVADYINWSITSPYTR